MFERPKVLFCLIILVRLRLNGGEARQHIRAGAEGRHGEPSRFSILEIWHARAEVGSSSRLPNLHTALQRAEKLTRSIGLHADRAAAILWLAVADCPAADRLSVLVENPHGIGASRERMF